MTLDMWIMGVTVTGLVAFLLVKKIKEEQ